ncbi:efflux RND transporter periplasmic adaptor subunit [Sphingobacterium corticibacter]|uniref:Efflux RND transporter periplasmic adaptor subunit n=1 Tax=Sphingobacterium corticibacter TaxID=2171749 RepID=A0A2T8HEW5_9SPHI|nr:efflux RND transporter periplasmic adaptor subunit [Sphingobacterium corticibacter]PVH23978.1 efflux RND transporter periplasmic adaptor subunit [Sphingobacterium corticibacter]
MTRTIYYLLLIGSTTTWQSCSSDKKEVGGSTPTEKTVSVTSVEEQIVTGYQEYPAYVVPLQETELLAEVSGYITNIAVSDGAFVTKGQKLYEIDRTRYGAEVEQAKANVAIAESEYARVQKDLERYENLAKNDAIARQTLDYAATDLQNQKAQVQAAKAALETANTNLTRSTIYAPFTGNLGISQVRNGALVNAGNTLLNVISTTSPIAVEFQVNEIDIERIIELQRKGGEGTITVRMPDGTIYPESGQIAVIDRAVDRTTGTLRVRASFANKDNRLRAGMNLTMRLANTSREKQLVIPLKAVLEQLGASNVYTVSDSSTAVFNTIQLGTKFNDKVVVRTGLKAGDRVVVDGASGISEGDKLSIEEK